MKKTAPTKKELLERFACFSDTRLLAKALYSISHDDTIADLGRAVRGAPSTGETLTQQLIEAVRNQPGITSGNRGQTPIISATHDSRWRKQK